MTKEFFFVFALVASLFASAAFADEDKDRPASCLMVVKGQRVIDDGECKFTPTDDKGSFQISSNDGKYFATVDISEKDVADGYWNEVPFAPHAHTSLGTLHREKACWVNDHADSHICAFLMVEELR